MSGASGVLVECPICRGEGVLSNNATDPQLQEDGDCHGCSGGGSVDRAHHAELVEQMNDVAAIEALQRLAEDDDDRAYVAQVERDLQHELAQRDREWWS